jgi:hypothetical protein
MKIQIHSTDLIIRKAWITRLLYSRSWADERCGSNRGICTGRPRTGPNAPNRASADQLPLSTHVPDSDAHASLICLAFVKYIYAFISCTVP